MSAVIGPGRSGEFPHISASGDFSRHRHDGDRTASLGFAASQWHEVEQPNKLLWGGARDRGKRALAVEGSLRWREQDVCRHRPGTARGLVALSGG